MLAGYLRKISDLTARGDAREESYYSSVEKIFSDYISLRDLKASVTTLPKKTEAGNPDFRIWDGNFRITGYVEAKLPSANLEQTETTEQLKRYLGTFPNLILTNFYEFRLYRNGTLIDSVSVGEPFLPEKLDLVPPARNEDGFFSLLEKFFAFSLPAVSSAEELSVQLALRTKFLRDEVIKRELEDSGNGKSNPIHVFFKLFDDYLIKDLSKEQFADLYSQTVTYGLFAARIRMAGNFNRKLAYANIPPTIGILKDLFRFISLGDLPRQMEWIIDDIAEVISVVNVKRILNDYFRQGKGNDPIVHFYETFLAEYDPKTREQRGVYYTPEPVVSYIVRSVNLLLTDKFGKADGFADASVTVLDPAAGTLTFLAKAAEEAVREFTDKYGEGGRKDFIKERILKNYHAFEIMMAPYAIGHLKMSILLEKFGYKLADKDRFKLYLTNTLEHETIKQTDIPGISSLAEESSLAGEVKRNQPVLAILGNPPYSGHSANKGEWIKDLVKEKYHFVDGRPLGEKNPKWLQDDYVKFIRFAQWKIDQAGEGVLGFITNHGYLDNPTFRGMRQSLMKTFNEIYILNLHGNSLKREKCPDGSKDENVFDIQQGTGIAFFVKKKNAKGNSVFHSELWGIRNAKYKWLEKNDIKTTEWDKLKPKSGFYLFKPQDGEEISESYEKHRSITEIFPVNSVGIVTARDRLVVHHDREELKRRFEMFCDEKQQDEIVRQAFKLKDTNAWKLNSARRILRSNEKWQESILPIIYRPFDRQWIVYSDYVVERTRKATMQNMLNENLSLIFCRQVKTSPNYCHCFVADCIFESCLISNRTSEIGYGFPLYLYPEGIFDGNTDRKPNIEDGFYESLGNLYGCEPTPEQIFYYVYAVLYSNVYREKYAEFLKMDFPRIPFVKDKTVFFKMEKLGKELTDLHLLKLDYLNKPKVKFEGKGQRTVEKVRYDKGKVFINEKCHFKGISSEMWEYMIGGYQVCSKWLKDRKGRGLSVDEIVTYCKLATAIEKTVWLQKKIDKNYREIESNMFIDL